jgi:hypothetical protein
MPLTALQKDVLTVLAQMIRHYDRILLPCEAVGQKCMACSRKTPKLSIPEQQIWFGDVRADTVARESLEGEGEGDTEVFWACRVFAQAKAERSGPTAHVAIDCVGLFLHAPVASVKTVKGAKAPVFVQAKVNAAVNEIVARSERGWPSAWVIAEIEIPQAKAPDVIGLQRDSVKSHAPMIIGDVVAIE